MLCQTEFRGWKVFGKFVPGWKNDSRENVEFTNTKFSAPENILSNYA